MGVCLSQHLPKGTAVDSSMGLVAVSSQRPRPQWIYRQRPLMWLLLSADHSASYIPAALHLRRYFGQYVCK